MKLNIIRTNTTLEGNRGIIDCLARQDTPESNHIVIAPDRFSLGVEQEICSNYCHNGSFNIDVVGFTRFAQKMLGNRINRCLTKEGTVILLNKLMLEIGDDLTFYKGINSYSFAKELFASLASFRNSGITVEQLKEKLTALEGNTYNKLSDIILIYSKYLEAINDNYEDTITRIDRLIEFVPQLTQLFNTDIYIMGFNIYSQQQLNLIKRLTVYCKSVTIAFIKDLGRNVKTVFINRQLDELVAFAGEKGVECVEVERMEKLAKPFDYLSLNMFGFNGKPLLKNDGKDKVVVFCATDPYEEGRSVAKEIAYLARNGYRYKDIAIACNNENYNRILAETFDRCDIPYFVEQKYFVKDSPIIKYLYILLNCAISNFDKRWVLDLCRHPFACLTREQIEIFENYVLEFNIDHNRFTREFYLGDCNKAEEIRKVLMKFLEIDIPKHATMGAYCVITLNILQSETVKRYIEENIDNENIIIKSSTDIDKYIEAVEDIRLLSEDTVISIDGYYEFLSTCTVEMGKGILPQFLDSVFIGNTADSRFANLKILFIIGANSGFFPKQGGDNLILTSFDCEIMKRADLHIYPTPIDLNSLERLVTVDLATKAKERLYVGYALSDTNGEALAVGDGVKELTYLLDIKKVGALAESHNFSEGQRLAYTLVNPANGYYEYVRGAIEPRYIKSVTEYLCKNGYADKFLGGQKSNESTINYADYFFRKDKKGNYVTSVSQIERYFACPYKHFLDYGLRLRERKDGSLKPLDLGNIIHKILENFFSLYGKKLRELQDIDKVIMNTIDNEILSVIYDAYRQDSIAKYMLDSVALECRRVLRILADNVLNSDFTPTEIEVAFGEAEDKKALIKVGDNNFSLIGKVDRVDTYNNNVVIIDYKTGSANGLGALKDVYFGHKIQLYVYLRVYINNGYRPSGVFYMPINSGYAVEGKSYCMKGQMRDDVNTLLNIDKRAEMGKSEAVPFYVDKKDSDKLKANQNLLSEGDFYNITQYTKKIIVGALGEISEGYREKNPYAGSCEYCVFANICGETPYRDGVSVKASDFVKKSEGEE